MFRNASNRTFLSFPKAENLSWKEPFYFIHIADPQFGMIEHYINKKKNAGWNVEIMLSEQSIFLINAMIPKPKFVVVCGDLVDAFPEDSSPYSIDHSLDEIKTLRYNQLKDFKMVFSKLDPSIPLVCVCGNHDIGNQPDSEKIALYTSEFGDDYFSFWCNGVFFLVLNSQLYKNPESASDLLDSQEAWLKQQFEDYSKQSSCHCIIFQHIPWFIHHSDESTDLYFNIEINLRRRMLEYLEKEGVSHVFSGHLHFNSEGNFGKNFCQVITSALGARLGNDDHGFRIVKIFEKGISHQYFSLSKCPVVIDMSDPF